MELSEDEYAALIQSRDEAREKSVRYQEKMREYYHKLLLYELLVSRYRNEIEKDEAKTIPDLKAMVQPNHPQVTEFADSVKKEAPGANTLRLCELAYDHLLGKIISVPSPEVTFWMTIPEIFKAELADREDMAILLCSIFRTLGASSSVLITELSDGSNRPFVILSTGEDYVLCDPNEKHDFFRYVATKEPLLLKKYHLDGKHIKKVLYEFNDTNYATHQEDLFGDEPSYGEKA